MGRLAAILAAHVVGHSRLMSEDEASVFDALQALQAHREERSEGKFVEHEGRINNTKDQCAVEIQHHIG